MNSSAIPEAKPKVPPPTTEAGEGHKDVDTPNPHAFTSLEDLPPNSSPKPIVTAAAETDESQSTSEAQSRFAFVSLEPLAAALDGMERTRIENENRLRAVVQMGADPEVEADAKLFSSVVDGLAKLEQQATKALEKAMRTHPLGKFVKATSGLGEKQTARLLAAIGDPYLRDVYDEEGNFIGTKPRTVSQLWALCGYHVISVNQVQDESHPTHVDGSGIDHRRSETHNRNVDAADSCNTDQALAETHRRLIGVAPFRRKGIRSNWNADAKTRAFLIAESCVKAKTSPYRKVYDEGRTKYAEAVHNAKCVRCGPKGKPALPGTPLSLGHQHARALRLVAKAVLKDLWVESKRLHEEDLTSL